MNYYLKEMYYDEPIPYKDLKIYPVTMKNYFEFYSFIDCLLLEKNNVPDVKIISMSYLEYLFYMSKEQDKPYLYYLINLLGLVLHIDDLNKFKFYMKDKVAYFSVEGKEFSAQDFDEISKIILEQNGVVSIDYTIQKEIRDALEKAESFRREQSKRKICSLEDQMICVLISTSLTLEDIYNLTLRKFRKILKRIDVKMHYQIYLNAQMSGFVKFDDKNEITHWMNDLEKEDTYGDVKVDLNEMKNKINGI